MDGFTIELDFFFPQAFLKIVFVKVLQQLRAYKLLYNFCHIQPFFFSFFFQ